ncbi:MAG: carbohydrate ABC transporter permease [Bacilli bacterium]|nr:carbohydrate ABC transporter permease [Bacilli bacterium]
MRKKKAFLGTNVNPLKFHKSQIKFILIVLPIVAVMMIPIIFIISHAFKPLDELFAYPPRIFVKRPTLENFRNLIEVTSQSGIPFSRYLFNSIIATSAIIFFTILIGSLAAFSFSFLHYRGKETLFKANQIAIMFVAIAVAVPRFIVIKSLGITNTYLAHIIPLLAMPVGVFLLKQFMDQIPRELYEASLVDGANKWQIYTKIVLPLVKPALATVAILAFQAAWNNVETSQLYVDDESLRTLPYFFSSLTLGTSGIAAQGMQAAASLIIFLPNLILFIILQSNVMSTMAHSGIK